MTDMRSPRGARARYGQSFQLPTTEEERIPSHIVRLYCAQCRKVVLTQDATGQSLLKVRNALRLAHDEWHEVCGTPTGS
jgi:hypothetical protein